MPWGSSSGRTVPLPPNWEALRREQLERDGYQCRYVSPDTGQRCTARATDVDHAGDAEDHADLRSLCSWHHRKRTAGQGARSPRRARATRPREQHPGLID